MKVLVLNADYLPMTTIGWQKAFTLHIKRVVDIVATYKNDGVSDTKGRSYEIPAVVILRKYIKRVKKEVPFSRKNIFIRDKYTCCYCNNKFQTHEITIDHVIPVSKWRKQNHNGRSPTSFQNCVTCCVNCNRKKANRTPQEAKMTANFEPKQPKYGEIVSGIQLWEETPDEWRPFLTTMRN